MKLVLLSVALILPSVAIPPAVGTISKDVVFTKASDFSSGRFQNLTDARLSGQSANVQVLVYLTPW